MIFPSPSVVAVALAGAVAVSLASGAAGYKLGRAAGDRDVRKMLEAGQQALVKRDKQIEGNLNEYRETLAAVSARRPKRVFICPPDNLSPSSGGTTGAGAAEPDRHNYEPDLRAARDALIRCNTLIEVVK